MEFGDKARTLQAIRNKPTPPSKARRPFPVHHKITKRTHRLPGSPGPESSTLPSPAHAKKQEIRNKPTPLAPLPSGSTAQTFHESRNTKHETRDTSESQSPTPQIFFTQSPQQLSAPPSPNHPKKLDPPCYSPAKAGKDCSSNQPRRAWPGQFEVALAVRTPPRIRFKA